MAAHALVGKAREEEEVKQLEEKVAEAESRLLEELEKFRGDASPAQDSSGLGSLLQPGAGRHAVARGQAQGHEEEGEGEKEEEEEEEEETSSNFLAAWQAAPGRSR